MQLPRRREHSWTFGIRWQNVVLWGALVLGLPFALFGMLMPANEYASWGGGGVDCDGPGVVVMLAFFSSLVYGVAALVFIRRAVRGRRWGAGLAAAACIALVAGEVNNWGNANREASTSSYREICLDPATRR
ncbi:MAG TPA: hypothetical protein VLK84_10025 [Longimicrobium sp.]|nr:hypothetical protein [Longimicrobium sp.]